MQTFRYEVMHSRLTVTLPAGPDAALHAAQVHAVFVSVERDANEWKADSPLAAVSRAAGDSPVPVPQGLFTLLDRAATLAQATDGAFDPTWAPLWPLWDFQKGKVPSREEVSAAVAHIDHRKLVLDPALRTAHLAAPGMVLGLGGIAKGWALDRASEALVAAGVKDFLLDIGQVTAQGRNGDRPWRVGVRDPRGGATDLLAEVDLVDASLSTSGDYERFFEHEGVRYHHLLDPRTGWPARGFRSVTVIAKEGALADAASTALFVVGDPIRALALAERLNIEALLVDAQGSWFVTPSLRSRLQKR